MKILKTPLKDLLIIKSKQFYDDRGYFRELIREVNVKQKFVFNIVSFSKKNVVRGLHYQSTQPQAKFISVVKGKILDVAVDLRKNSKTFGKVFKKIISSKNLLGVLIPKGFVHGVVILENNKILINFCSSEYNPKKEFGINIKSINLKFPKMKLYISNKDKNLIELNKFIKKTK